MRKFTFKNALEYLEWSQKFGIKEGLERIKIITTMLNNPQNLYKTIHVTGTNGKGSVCAMLSEMLKIHGLRVGLFTSPHLENYCERIKINGINISECDFAEMISKVESCKIIATHFEILTAAAFLYFAEKKIDIAVIEVGLGGTYDSTNIINPEISIITNVTLDHENILGDIENISLNKAGIIKKDVITITGSTGRPLEIIRKIAAGKNSPLCEISSPTNLEMKLRGEFQKVNAAIAIKAAEILGLSAKTIQEGLLRVNWNGRFEIFETDFGKIIIDGAHNPHGALALRNSLDKYFPNEKLVWLFSVLNDKNFVEMIKILFRSNDYVIVTKLNLPRATKTKTICEILYERNIPCLAVEDISSAVEKLINLDCKIKVISGSLYLVGAVRKLIKSLEREINDRT